MANENVPTNGAPSVSLAGTKFERLFNDFSDANTYLHTLAYMLIRDHSASLECEALAVSILNMTNTSTIVRESLRSEVSALLERVQQLEAAHV
jgi:hypothetical protein